MTRTLAIILLLSFAPGAFAQEIADTLAARERAAEVELERLHFGITEDRGGRNLDGAGGAGELLCVYVRDAAASACHARNCAYDGGRVRCTSP